MTYDPTRPLFHCWMCWDLAKMGRTVPCSLCRMLGFVRLDWQAKIMSQAGVQEVGAGCAS